MKLFMRVLNGRPIDHPQSEYGMKILFPPEQYPQYDYIDNIDKKCYNKELEKSKCYKLIKYKILNEKISIPSKNKKILIINHNIHNDKNILNNLKFTGISLDSLFFLIFLFQNI